jgi:transposase
MLRGGGFPVTATETRMSARYRLMPTPEQVAVLREHSHHARFVWNLGHEQRSAYRPGRGATPGFAEQCRQLTEARKAEPWLAEGSVNVQQQALRDLDQAWRNFFAGTHRRPGWRKAARDEGFRITDFNFATQIQRLNRRWGQLRIPKVGWVRFRWTRAVPAAKSYRVTLDRAARWHVSFPAAKPATAGEVTGKRVGIDRGVRTALVTSAGQHYRAPRIADRSAQRYIALARKLARQRKGSAKRARTVRAMARITACVADRRKDWADKVSTRLVRDNDLIVLERLNIAGMTRKPAPKPDPELPGAFLPNRARSKAALSRGILASCWGTLAERLEQKAEASGVAVIYVDPRFTSQQCHACGHTATESRESQAQFRCVECGHEDHADRNAARNILARGLAALGGEIPARAPGHGAYRPQKPAQFAAAGTTRSAA